MAVRMTCWFHSSLCSFPQVLPFLYCLQTTAFCLSETKNAVDPPSAQPPSVTLCLCLYLVALANSVWAGFALCLLSRLHEAFPISHSAPQAGLSSKQGPCLLDRFSSCSLVLPPEVAGLQRENGIREDQTRAAGNLGPAERLGTLAGF